MLILSRQSTRCLAHRQFPKGSVIYKPNHACRTRRDATSAGDAAEGAVKASPSPKMWETVQIICRDGTLPASAEVLAIASPQLERMIQAKVQESLADGNVISKPLELEMRDTSMAGLEELLRLLHYEPSSYEAGLDSIYTMLPLAQQMGMRKLLTLLDIMAADKLPPRLADLLSGREVHHINGNAVDAQHATRDYLLKWFTAAAMYDLPRVKAVCTCRLKASDKPWLN